MSKNVPRPGKKKKPEKSGTGSPGIKIYLALAAVVIVTFIIYSQVMGFNFSNLDDTVNILSNKQITSLSLAHIKEMFSKTYVQMYTPVTMFSFAIDYFFAGGLNPAYFHFFNLFYHLVNIVLVFIFIRKLSKSDITAVVAAAFFGIDPMATEIVAWVSSRNSVTFTAFGLAALIFYLRYLDENYNRKYLLVSVLLFACSLLSKPALILLPLVLLAIDYYRGRQWSLKLIIDKIPFGILSAAALAAVLFARSTDVAAQKQAFPIISRLFFATYGLSFYVVKLFAPVNLCVVNPFPAPGAGLPVIYYLSVLIIPLFGLLIYKAGKLKKDVAFGLVFFVINLVLVLQLLPYGYSVVSERYVYLPYLGLFFIIGQFATAVYNNAYSFSDKVKPLLAPVFAVFVTFFCYETYSHTAVWETPLTLFDDAVVKRPGSFYVAYCNGVAHQLYGDNTTAMSEYSRALQLRPGYAEAYAARGTLYDAANNHKAALADYDKALALGPYLYETFYNRGNNKLLSGNNAGAVKDYDAAINGNPVYDDALCNRGTAWLNLNNLPNACADWTKSAALGNKNAITLKGQHCK